MIFLGKLTQALYAHMNNKTTKKIKEKESHDTWGEYKLIFPGRTSTSKIVYKRSYFIRNSEYICSIIG
jgi:hypothetical protein